MGLLDRYVAKIIAAAIIGVLFVVVGIDAIFSLIDELNDLEGSYQAWQAFQYIVTTLPRRCYEYISLASLLGCLLGLGALANNSELTVMRAAGVSIQRIAWLVIKPALAFVFVAILVGEYVVPTTESIAQSRRALAQSGGEALKSKHGYWHREGNQYMHFNAVLPGGAIYGVTQYTFDDNHRLEQSRFAHKALFQGDHWVLQKVVITDLTPTASTVSTAPSLRWDTELTPAVLKVAVVDPEDLSAQGLYTYTSYLADQGLDAKKYRLAFWKKVLQPLATVVMVLVALSCVFGPLRSVTMGFRVFSGILLGLLFKYAEDFLGPASIVFGFSPIIASLVPILIFALLAVVLLRRVG